MTTPEAASAEGESVEIFNRLEEFPERLRGGVLSIGKFDGLHLGHRVIISRAVETGRRRNAPVVVFTFSPSPAAILRPETAPAPLVDPEIKREMLASLGVDALIEFPTSREFLAQSAEEFFQNTVVERLGAVAMVEGESFTFGNRREGLTGRLERLVQSFGVTLEVAPSVAVSGDVVSSSAIRRTLEAGDVDAAATMLGRRYCVAGIVGHGDERGRTLGYPTANLEQTGVFLPGNALYAALALTESGLIRPAAVNLGGNPTFGIEKRKIEAYLLDFDGDLYDQKLTLEFYAKLRDVMKFPNRNALLRQMEFDVERLRELFSSEN